MRRGTRKRIVYSSRHRPSLVVRPKLGAFSGRMRTPKMLYREMCADEELHGKLDHHKWEPVMKACFFESVYNEAELNAIKPHETELLAEIRKNGPEGSTRKLAEMIRGKRINEQSRIIHDLTRFAMILHRIAVDRTKEFSRLGNTIHKNSMETAQLFRHEFNNYGVVLIGYAGLIEKSATDLLVRLNSRP